MKFIETPNALHVWNLSMRRNYLGHMYLQQYTLSWAICIYSNIL